MAGCLGGESSDLDGWPYDRPEDEEEEEEQQDEEQENCDPPDPPPCPAGHMRIDGELVDLASRMNAVLPIVGATVTHRGSALATTSSNDGRFSLCTPIANNHVFDVDAPGALLDAIVANSNGLDQIEMRMMTAAAANTLYAAHGMQFDPARAHVLVATFGMGGDIELENAAHGTALATPELPQPGPLVWTPGTQGRYVLFPNVAITGASATVHHRGLLDLTETTPLEPGVLTIVVIGSYFCFVAPCV
ncbi:MAG: hypothetical protein H0T42_13080 [Deltaproteobacteria bacterium]|nr:hypothetical protein [Deltaproteobacteria bacterium]